MAALPSKYLFGIIIFVALFTGGVIFLSGMNGGALDVEGQNFNKTLDKQEQLQEKMTELQDSFAATPDQGLFGMLNALIQTSWNTLKTMFTSFTFMNEVFTSLSGLFGIPAFYAGLAILAVVAIIAFAILGAVFQTKL